MSTVKSPSTLTAPLKNASCHFWETVPILRFVSFGIRLESNVTALTFEIAERSVFENTDRGFDVLYAIVRSICTVSLDGGFENFVNVNPEAFTCAVVRATGAAFPSCR